MRAESIIHSQDRHGEGIFWSTEHELLYWTDIFGERAWTFDPATSTPKSWKMPGRLCCFATRAGRPWNQVVAAFSDRFTLLDLESAEVKVISSFETDKPMTRLNDGRTDRQGRFIAGGMDESGGFASSVWRLNPDLSLTMLFDGVGCANGTCFSADGRTLWFADSYKGSIEAFDYEIATGVPTNRRAIATTPKPGVPDGACIDVEGYVWSAVWEGYRVERYSPDGRLDRVIDIPVKKPTCCAFGGAGFDTLFITSSRHGENADDLLREPEAGDLFAVKPGIHGLADQPFAG